MECKLHRSGRSNKDLARGSLSHRHTVENVLHRGEDKVADLITVLAYLLKPNGVALVSILLIVIIAQIILLNRNHLFRIIKGNEGKITSKYDRKVKTALKSIYRISISRGFNFKTSTTIREVTSFLQVQFPDQSTTLAKLTRSLESHIYGNKYIESDDNKYYTGWVSFSKKEMGR